VHLEAWLQEGEKTAVGQHVFLKSRPFKSWLGASLVFVWFACGILFLGILEGKYRSVFPTLGDGKLEVVLRRYGDQFVLAKVDVDSHLLLPEFRLVKADELKDRLVMRRIGPLAKQELKQYRPTATAASKLPRPR
jgi:hypothetical protein